MVKNKKSSRLHKVFRRTPKASKKPVVRKLAWNSGWSLGKQALGMVKRWPKLFLGLTAIYIVITWLFAGGASQETYLFFKDSLNEFLGNSANVVSRSASLFTLTATGSLDQSEDTLQSFLSGFLLLGFWLILIWAARYLLADKAITIRDALYNGLAPLVSSILTLLVVLVQALPAGLMIALYVTATESGIVGGAIETFLLAVVAILASVLSLYWIAGSLMGLIIVTLPGMYPLKALAASRELVYGQRFMLLAQIAWLAVWVIAIMVVVLTPLLLLDNAINVNALPIIPFAAQVLGGVCVLFSALYAYRLYRTLL